MFDFIFKQKDCINNEEWSVKQSKIDIEQKVNSWQREKWDPYIALHAPGTWYLRCSFDNQYLAWVFKLSASKANSKFSFAVWYTTTKRNQKK